MLEEITTQTSYRRKELKKRILTLNSEEKADILIKLRYEGANYKLLASVFSCNVTDIIDFLKEVDLKFCTKCHKTKSFSKFHIANTRPDGHVAQCNDCCHEKRKKYYNKKQKGNSVEYEKMISWKRNNRGRISELRKIRNQDPLVKKKNADYQKNRVDNNPLLRLRMRFSNLLYYHLKEHTNGKVKKNGRSIDDILDYTMSDLVEHLESKFQPGMTWDNYGHWHIDHIRPVSYFIITSLECDEFKKCWSLDNLQPLWAGDNLSKGNRYIG